MTQTLFLLAILLGEIHSPAQTNASFQIEGTLTWPDDGCTQAVVVLCDRPSGEPLCRQTAQPFTLAIGTTNENFIMDWLQAVPDSAGRFQFTNLPAGNYIVVAEGWKGRLQPIDIQEFSWETIHLLGRAEVTVPSDSARHLKLTAPGTNRIQFQQQQDGSWLLLGTRPQRGDPVLAWLGWGTNFISHIIGFNVMPRGLTTVHGLPDEAYASIFVNDDSPGFGSTRLPLGDSKPIKMPIVANWSDGYKIPPTNLVWLVELLETNRFKIDALLGIASKPRSDKFNSSAERFAETERERFRLVQPIWEKEIVLPTGQKTRVVDLQTALGYARLNGKSKN